MRLSSLHQRTSTMGEGAGCTCLWHGIAQGKPPNEVCITQHGQHVRAFTRINCWIAAPLQEKCTG